MYDVSFRITLVILQGCTLRNATVDEALKASLSLERLGKYLSACDGDLSRALTLYERNTRLSEALYAPLQSVEVCLRNALERSLAARYGAQWMHDDGVPLARRTRDEIAAAEAAVSRAATPTVGAIVAELRFGFWVGLLGQGYDHTLWRQALHRAFPHGRGLKRRLVHGRFNMLRRLRNRVAHHEPIHDRDLAQDHGELIEAIRWVCPHTAAWTAYNSRLLVELGAE
ncbi:hypothetical protein [Alsobacter sp. R-9]